MLECKKTDFKRHGCYYFDSQPIRNHLKINLRDFRTPFQNIPYII